MGLNLRTELGMAYVNEDYYDQADRDYWGPAWVLDYDQLVWQDRLQLYNRNMAFSALDDTSKQLWRSWTGVRVPLLAALFERAVDTSLTQIQSIRDETEAPGDEDLPEALGVDLQAPLEQIESRLKKARADLAAANTQRADFERHIALQENRPATVRQRITAAREQQAALAAMLQGEPATDERPALIQARRWRLETQYMALSAEIAMLESDLLSQPVRVNLLKAKRDREDPALLASACG